MRRKCDIVSGSEACGQDIRADGFAVEFRHADAEAQEHAFDLVVLTLIDREAAGSFRQGNYDGFLREYFFLREEHAFAECFDRFGGDDVVGFDEVRFRNSVTRPHEGFRKNAVVGEDDETGCRTVEPSCEMEIADPWFADQIEHRAVRGIGGGGKDASGFVHQEIARDVGLKDFARNCELVEFAELLRTIGDGGLVQAHFAAANDGFGMAFPQACLLSYELCDGHAGVSHPEMSLRESQALRRVAIEALK